MRITVDIPDGELEDAIRFTKAKSRREAVLHAVVAFNRRMRMAALARHSGTCPDLITPEELQATRRQA